MSKQPNDVNLLSNDLSAPLPISELKSQHDRITDAAYYEAFVACTADAIIGFDVDGRMTHWNPGAEQIFGYSAEEAIGQTYLLLGTSEVYEFQKGVFARTLEGTTHQWYDTRRRRKDGSLIDVSITTSPLLIDDKVCGAVAIVRDSTEKVKAAQELSLRNAELDEAAQQLTDINAQLKAQAEEKRQFVNMVIHDLRHPLTAMRTVLYLLQHDDNTAQHGEYVKVIEGRLHALNTLLDELTEYHRIEAGRTQLRIEPVDAGALIRDCVANFVPALIGDQVKIVCDVDKNLGVIATDDGKLTHILLNLLSNALKFTPKGTITVFGRCEDEHYWSLTVEDTGQGIRPEAQSRVFEEFYQAEETPRRQHGTGLGLSIVKQLCTTLHGKTELMSEYGRGTKFRLIFPYRFESPLVMRGDVVQEET